MGGKSRIAKHIVPIIQKYINDNNIKTYLEPFCGGANVIDKIVCENKYGSDINKYLIALLKRIQDGYPLLDEVSKELYLQARESFKNSDCNFEDWEIGNIGFLASFNGGWFGAGYAKTTYEKTKNGMRLRNFYQEAKNNILNQAPNIKNIQFACRDYKEYTYLNGCLIYCDPPYQNTRQHVGADNFNHNEFWDVMREWSKNNIVLISEQSAPDDFECIWEQKINRSINVTRKKQSVEKLFIYRGGGHF